MSPSQENRIELETALNWKSWKSRNACIKWQTLELQLEILWKCGPNWKYPLRFNRLFKFNCLFGYLLRIRLAPMTSSLGKLANNQFCSQAIFPQEAMQELKSKSWSAKYLSSKGQLISKGLFGINGILNSPKNWTKKFNFTTMILQVTTCYRLFFGRNWRHQKDVSKLTDLYFTQCTTLQETIIGKYSD